MKKSFIKLFAVLFLSLVFSSSLLAEALWIDVRSDKEYQQENLGDLHIPHNQIGELITKHAENKDAEIKLYCRSGGRAGMAKKKLESLGYTHVSNEGGIADARNKKEADKKETK